MTAPSSPRAELFRFLREVRSTTGVLLLSIFFVFKGRKKGTDKGPGRTAPSKKNRKSGKRSGAGQKRLQRADLEKGGTKKGRRQQTGRSQKKTDEATKEANKALIGQRQTDNRARHQARDGPQKAPKSGLTTGERSNEDGQQEQERNEARDLTKKKGKATKKPTGR